MRVQRALIWPKAHGAQQRFHPGSTFGSRTDIVDVERFSDLRCDGESAIQSPQGVLENHLHARAQLPPSRAARLRHGGAFKADTPRIRRFHA